MFYYTPVHHATHKGGRIVLIPVDDSIISVHTVKWTIARFRLGPMDSVCLVNIRNEVVEDIRLLNALELGYSRQIGKLHRDYLQMSFRILGLLAKELFKANVNVMIASLCQLKDHTMPEIEWDLSKVVQTHYAFAVLNEKFVDSLYEAAISHYKRIPIFLPHH